MNSGSIPGHQEIENSTHREKYPGVHELGLCCLTVSAYLKDVNSICRRTCNLAVDRTEDIEQHRGRSSPQFNDVSPYMVNLSGVLGLLAVVVGWWFGKGHGDCGPITCHCVTVRVTFPPLSSSLLIKSLRISFLYCSGFPRLSTSSRSYSAVQAFSVLRTSSRLLGVHVILQNQKSLNRFEGWMSAGILQSRAKPTPLYKVGYTGRLVQRRSFRPYQYFLSTTCSAVSPSYLLLFLYYRIWRRRSPSTRRTQSWPTPLSCPMVPYSPTPLSWPTTRPRTKLITRRSLRMSAPC